MRRPTAASLKKVTPENLARLGAERLAEILLAAAETKPELKRRLRMELAAEQGAEHLLPEIDKRLAALATSRSKVGWRQRPTFIRDLDALRTLITERLGALDRKAALDRMWLFMGLFRKVSHRLYDRHGELEAVFARAAGDLGAALDGADPASGLALAEAIASDPHDWGGWLEPVLEKAAPDLAAVALRSLSERPGASAAWLSPIRRLADSARDPDAFAATFTPAALKQPSVAAEVAERLLAVGRVEEAGAVLRGAAKTKPKVFGPARASDEVDFDWETIWIDYLERSGDPAAAQAARWAGFERTLCVDRLKAFTARLADFDDVEAEQKAFAHAAARKDIGQALAFLMAWPARAEAARLIEARADEIDLPADEAERWAAELQGRHPRAAHTLLRKSAAAAFRRRDFKTCDRLTAAADAIDG